MKTFAIYCTSRTGSTWLCEMLMKTGEFGPAGEHFNPEIIVGLQEQVGLSPDCSLEEYWKAACFYYGAPERMVVKCGWPVAPDIHELIKPEACVFLSREDKIRQAVSLYRSEMTNVWAFREKPKQCDIVVGEILQRLTNIVVAEHRILGWLQGNGIEPLDVTYEELCLDPMQNLVDIAEHFGRPLDRVKTIETKIRIDDWTANAVKAVNEALGVIPVHVPLDA